MSASQSQIFSAPSPPSRHGEALDRDPRLLQNHDYHLNVPPPTSTTVDHQQSGFQWPILEDAPKVPDALDPWQTHQACHNPGIFATLIPHMPMPYGFEPMVPSNISEISYPLSWPATTTEGHGANMMSTDYSPCDPTQSAARLDGHVASDPLRNSWTASSHRQPLFPIVGQGPAAPWYSVLGQSNAGHPLHSSSSYTTHFLCPPPYQPYNPSSPHHSPCLTSTGSVEPRSNLSFYHAPRRDSARTLHRRRGARAIEYNELWIDEEELLNGLAEFDGKINVHQCHWEEDRTPCHLWIKGDKSSINTHVQKWHEGRFGGDKYEAVCHWSACGHAMLKESIARHIVRKHLGERWECRGCGKEVPRNDVFGQHTEKSKFAACQTSGARVTYLADMQVIDARVALDSGGRLRYAGAERN